MFRVSTSFINILGLTALVVDVVHNLHKGKQIG